MAQSIIRHNRLYIPANLIKGKELDDFVTYFFDEKMCRKCPELENRFSYLCATCPSYKGTYESFKVVQSKEKGKYYAFARGNQSKTLKRFGLQDYEVKDLTVAPKAKNPLTFTGQLYTGQVVNNQKTIDQVSAVETVLSKLKERGDGILIAAPRSGKTVMAVNIITQLKLRTLILTHQDSLLSQFANTFQNVTNLAEVEAQGGKKVVVVAQSQNDLVNKDADVVLTTYQRLISQKGRKVLKGIMNDFGLVIVDEVHKTGADCFSEVVNELNSKYRLSFTATLERKDGREVIVVDAMGKPLIKVAPSSIKPTMHGIYVKNVKMLQKTYTNLLSAIDSSDAVDEAVIEKVFEILKEGPDKNVVIVSRRTQQIVRLTKRINQEANRRNNELDEEWPPSLCQSFTGKVVGKARDTLLENARSGKVRVTVAQLSLCRDGIDVPAWTDMLIVIPIASKISPDPEFYQLTMRVCTPAPFVKTPRIYQFLYPNAISAGCLLSQNSKSVVALKYNVDSSYTEAITTAQKTLGRRASGPATYTAGAPW